MKKYILMIFLFLINDHFMVIDTYKNWDFLYASTVKKTELPQNQDSLVLSKKEKEWIFILKNLFNKYSISENSENPIDLLISKAINENLTNLEIIQNSDTKIYPLILSNILKTDCDLAEGKFSSSNTQANENQTGICQFYLSKLQNISNKKLEPICKQLASNYSTVLFQWNDKTLSCKPSLYIGDNN